MHPCICLRGYVHVGPWSQRGIDNVSDLVFYVNIIEIYVEYYISAGFNFQSFSEKKIHVNLIGAGRGKYTDIII